MQAMYACVRGARAVSSEGVRASETSVPHIRAGCSTVAVSWAGIKCNAYLCLYVLPANRKKIREPTSGLEPLTCSLRVCGQWLLDVARVCKFRLDNGISVPCVAHYCRVLRSG